MGWGGHVSSLREVMGSGQLCVLPEEKVQAWGGRVLLRGKHGLRMLMLSLRETCRLGALCPS